jgi:hypothetical protein
VPACARSLPALSSAVWSDSDGNDIVSRCLGVCTHCDPITCRQRFGATARLTDMTPVRGAGAAGKDGDPLWHPTQREPAEAVCERAYGL